MARPRQNYLLFRKKGSKYFHYTYYDVNGLRHEKSTGCTTKSDAVSFCEHQLKTKKLDLGRIPTLKHFVEERHFYEWTDLDGCLCQYALSKNQRANPDRPAVQRNYIERCKAVLDTYILPTFKNCKLDQIQVDELEKWMDRLHHDKGLAPKTVLNYSSVFKIILDEAIRLNYAITNPFDHARAYSGVPRRRRDCLDLEEAKVLMNPRTIEEVWGGNRINYLASLVAMATGLRQGEIIALQKCDLHPDHLDIRASWDIRHHTFTPGKTKDSVAPIVIPRYVYEQLFSFATWDTGFILSYTCGKTPVTGNRLTDGFYKALDKIGIHEKERTERNIVFHSWRIFFNSYLRTQNISDAKIRAETRHTSQRMTDHYTVWRAENFAEVREAQEALVMKLISAM
jgi:integrase